MFVLGVIVGSCFGLGQVWVIQLSNLTKKMLAKETKYAMII